MCLKFPKWTFILDGGSSYYRCTTMIMEKCWIHGTRARFIEKINEEVWWACFTPCMVAQAIRVGQGARWSMTAIDDSIGGVGHFEQVAWTVYWAAINRYASRRGDRVDSGGRLLFDMGWSDVMPKFDCAAGRRRGRRRRLRLTIRLTDGWSWLGWSLYAQGGAAMMVARAMVDSAC